LFNVNASFGKPAKGAAMSNTLSWPAWLQTGGIQFIWPSLLWLLLILPAGVIVYYYLRRQQSFDTWNVVSGVLVTLGLTALLIAIARPQVQVSLPARADRLMIVLDISGSMRADDAEPSRFDAAKVVISNLLDNQPPGLQVGLVTTAATASLVQPLTTDRNALREALNATSLQTGSALGSGLLIGLSELLPAAGIDAQAIMNESTLRQDSQPTKPWQPDPEKIMPPGSNRSVALVLISDGDSNMGPNALMMAEIASQFGVRVHTIGLGTEQGAVVKADGISQRVRLQPALLADISATTIGHFYQGTTEKDWQKIYQAIDTNIQFDRRQPVEFSVLFLAIGLLLILVGMVIRLVRLGRIL
jgi:Ca-activated chloride channel family protein